MWPCTSTISRVEIAQATNSFPLISIRALYLPDPLCILVLILYIDNLTSLSCALQSHIFIDYSVPISNLNIIIIMITIIPEEANMTER